MDLAAFFDRKHWTGTEGCLLLIFLNENFSQLQKNIMKNELSKHSRKSTKSTVDFIKASIESNYFEEDNLALTEYIKICEVYNTYFNIEEKITPYQFISWAKDRESFTVPKQMLEWYRKKNAERKSKANMRYKEEASISQNEIVNMVVEGHGFCSLVINFRHEGKSDAEIARHLKEMGLSRLVIGVLLSRDAVPLSDSGYRAKCDRLIPQK